MAVRRTTIELDEELLAQAQRILGQSTMRSTVEEALRRAIKDEQGEDRARVERQRQYFDDLSKHVDLDVLASDEMWR
jgi:Arc/MetJ family transcription regulator